MNDLFINKLRKVLTNDQILFDEEMKNHTTFSVGGKADLFITPNSIEQLREVINMCKSINIPYIVIGKGSNLIVRDNGYRGVVICTSKFFTQCQLLDNNCIKADAGITLAKLANFALSHNFTGLEFASGIPGTFGGAIYMNAGAYGGEIKDVFVSCELLSNDGDIITVNKEEMKFGYRTSLAHMENYTILSGTVKLSVGEQEIIKSKMVDLNTQRSTKQPIELPSAGSTFKRPPGHFAGQLIMESGLKGYTIGGAMVSTKHCGFVVNNDNATAEDIINLMKHIQNTVYDKYNVLLEPEVKIIGE